MAQESGSKRNFWKKYDALKEHDLYDLGAKQLASQGFIDPEIYWEMDERAQNGSDSAQLYLKYFNEGYKSQHGGKANPNWTSGDPSTGSEKAPGTIRGTPFTKHPAAAGSVGSGSMAGGSQTSGGNAGDYGGNKVPMPGTQGGGAVLGPVDYSGIPQEGPSFPQYGPNAPAGGPPYKVGTEVGHDRPDPPGAYGFSPSNSQDPGGGGGAGFGAAGDPSHPAFNPATSNIPIIGNLGGYTGGVDPALQNSLGVNTTGGSQYGGLTPQSIDPTSQLPIDTQMNLYQYGPDAFVTKQGYNMAGLDSWFNPDDPTGMHNMVSDYYGDQGEPTWMADRDSPFLSDMNTLSMFDDPRYAGMTNAEKANLTPERLALLNDNKYIDYAGYYDDIVSGDKYVGAMQKGPNGEQVTATPEAQGNAVMQGIQALKGGYSDQAMSILQSRVEKAYQDWNTGIQTDPQFRATYGTFTSYLRDMGANDWM